MLRLSCWKRSLLHGRLIKFTVEGIRTKLDRIYLESLEASTQSSAINRVPPDEVSTLQEELESLYAEILPVAQMSTEQQFLEPALKALAAKNGHSLVRSAQATGYVSNINMRRPFQLTRRRFTNASTISLTVRKILWPDSRPFRHTSLPLMLSSTLPEPSWLPKSRSQRQQR